MTTNDYMNPELRDWLLAASFGEGWSRESEAAGESRDVPGEIFEAPVLPLRETTVFLAPFLRWKLTASALCLRWKPPAKTAG